MSNEKRKTYNTLFAKERTVSTVQKMVDFLRPYLCYNNDKSNNTLFHYMREGFIVFRPQIIF